MMAYLITSFVQFLPRHYPRGIVGPGDRRITYHLVSGHNLLDATCYFCLLVIQNFLHVVYYRLRQVGLCVMRQINVYAIIRQINTQTDQNVELSIFILS